jgi:hypothetical protein
MHAGAITGRRGVIMPAKPLAAAAGTPPTPVPAAEVTVLPPEWAVAGTHLFREQALAAYMRGDREARMLRAEPAWTRSVVAAGAILALTVALLATFGRVDVTTEGVGILRAEGDLQFARAEIAGMVSEVHARSGDLVEAGQAIVTLESASLQAALLEADRRLQAARTAAVELDSRRLPLFAQRRANLEDGVRMLDRRRDAERRGLGRKAVRASPGPDGRAASTSSMRSRRCSTRRHGTSGPRSRSRAQRPRSWRSIWSATRRAAG